MELRTGVYVHRHTDRPITLLLDYVGNHMNESLDRHSKQRERQERRTGVERNGDERERERERERDSERERDR